MDAFVTRTPIERPERRRTLTHTRTVQSRITDCKRIVRRDTIAAACEELQRAMADAAAPDVAAMLRILGRMKGMCVCVSALEHTGAGRLVYRLYRSGPTEEVKALAKEIYEDWRADCRREVERQHKQQAAQHRARTDNSTKTPKEASSGEATASSGTARAAPASSSRRDSSGSPSCGVLLGTGAADLEREMESWDAAARAAAHKGATSSPGHPTGGRADDGVEQLPKAESVYGGFVEEGEPGWSDEHASARKRPRHAAASSHADGILHTRARHSPDRTASTVEQYRPLDRRKSPVAGAASASSDLIESDDDGVGGSARRRLSGAYRSLQLQHV